MSVGDDTGGGRNEKDFELAPGAILDLLPYESVEIADPKRPNAAFDQFVLAVLRQVGVALEIPFEMLVKHFTASYSAAQAALLEAWKFFRARREWLATMFCQPVYEAVITEAVARGHLPVTDSMDAYADKIGLTFFDDHYDFDDQSNEEGLLTVEESPPLGTEDNTLFGGVFDAEMLFDDDIILLTEIGLILLADNVGIPFETDRGYILTLEHGDALEIAAHEGYILQTQEWEDMPVQVGGGFYEGDGQSTLIEGGDRELLIGGLAPWHTVIKAGQSIMPVEGHAHLILENVTTDINGLAAVPIAPKLRTTISEQPLVLGGIKVLMRLTNDDAGNNRTVPPCRSTYTLTFEQIL